jgi:hypothetical protein
MEIEVALWLLMVPVTAIVPPPPPGVTDIVKVFPAKVPDPDPELEELEEVNDIEDPAIVIVPPIEFVPAHALVLLVADPDTR